MMGQFWVKAAGADVHHPIDAARPLPISQKADWLHNDHFESC